MCCTTSYPAASGKDFDPSVVYPWDSEVSAQGVARLGIHPWSHGRQNSGRIEIQVSIDPISCGFPQCRMKSCTLDFGLPFQLGSFVGGRLL